MKRIQFNFFVSFVIWAFCLNVAVLHAQTLELKNDWQICPTKDYLPNTTIDQLDCKPIELPNKWETVLGKYDGFAVLQTHFKAPQNLKNNQLAFFAKRIRDADKVFINGQLVGETGEFPPDFEKAVFYSRLYPIPLNVLDFDKENELVIWVYNDVRPGGLVAEAPQIGDYSEFVAAHHKTNYLTLALIVMLCVFSLIHIMNFGFNKNSKDTLYFGLFLLSWSLYIVTGSDLMLQLNLNLNIIFRLNESLFFLVFTFFILFPYAFFQHPVPKILKIFIFLALSFVPLAFLLPEPKHVYYPIELIEILSVPGGIMILMLLYSTVKNKLPYAKIMTLVLSLYLTFALIEILLDLFFANEATSYSPVGPWILLLLSLALTFIIGHKNMSYYEKATFDSLTQVLRFDCFIDRCKQLILEAEKDDKPILVMMLDLDNFKAVNDEHGHIAGDKMLIKVANLMKSQLRQFDLIGRYGGDEFCIALMMNSQGDIKNLVNRIHKKINGTEVSINQQTKVALKATIGVTIYEPQNPRFCPNILIEQADEKLIQGKSKTKGRVIW